MIKLTQANTGKDVWVNPTYVVVVESHPVTRIPNGSQDETRIVLSNGGWVQVVGNPATVLAALGWAGRA